MTFYRCIEAEAMAYDLLDANHGDRCMVSFYKDNEWMQRHPRIFCVIQSDPWKVKGRVVAADIRVLSGLNAFLLDLPVGDRPIDPEPLFLIRIQESFWTHAEEKMKLAVMDHELCHARVYNDPDKGTYSLGLMGHDLEEFNEIVARHGAYGSDVEDFLKAAARGCPGQLRLSLMADSDRLSSALMDSIEALRPTEGSITIEAAGKSVTLEAKKKRSRKTEPTGDSAA